MERFNRTLKSKLMRSYERNGNYNWIDYLEDFVENYNNTFHTSIGMKPKDVNDENKFTVWGRLFGHLANIKKPKYEIGDKVRVLKLTIQYRGSAQLRSGFRGGPKKNREESKKTLGDKFKEKYEKYDPEKVASTSNVVGTKRPPFSVEIFDINNVLLGDPNVYKLWSEEFDREVLGIFYEEELSLVKEE